MTDQFEKAKGLFVDGLDFLLHENYAKAEQKFLDALVLMPGRVSVLTNLSAALLKQGKIAESKKYAQRSIELEPGNAEGWMNLGECLAKENSLQEALLHSGKAIALKPLSAEVWSNRCNILRQLGRFDEALAACEKALELKPGLAEAWANRVKTLRESGRLDEALVACERAMELKPDMPYLLGVWSNTKLALCDWSGFQETSDEIMRAVESGKPASSPFSFLATSASPALQKKCAEIYVADKFLAAREKVWKPVQHKHDRIRLGYFSSDFRMHAVSFLAAGMFEAHDRSRFELIGFNLHAPTNDEMERRVAKAFDEFVDLSPTDFGHAVELIRQKELDIAIDLNGHTDKARTELFCQRVAPIQVNYLGYPGTMGADFMDYIIGDGTLIPEHCRDHYSEKVAYLPHSFQVNDAKRQIAPPFSRQEVGLPSEGFIFCCFNNSYKLTPELYDVWLRLLSRVDGSVLWLVKKSDSQALRLKERAVAKGISGDRIVFAETMPYAQHLARYQLADLALDTMPFGGGTTTSDSLWAGVPVLTYVGESFAARMSASLLNAVGLPELVTRTIAEYETLAYELASNARRLAEIKTRLAQNRNTFPLFDTALFTQHIEAAYTKMYDRYQAGLPPDHVHVNAINK